MKTTCYLIVRAEKESAVIYNAKIVSVRQTYPSLAADEAAIKVSLDIPAELFDARAVALVVEPRKAILAVEQEDAALSGGAAE